MSGKKALQRSVRKERENGLRNEGNMSVEEENPSVKL